MKKIYVKHHPWITMSILALAIGSCRKSDTYIQEQQPEQSQQSIERKGGVAPDDPKLLARLRVIVSPKYISLRTTPTGTKKGGNGSGGTTTTDATSPSITITSPANGAEVTGTVNVTVNATDNVSVTSVSYTVDGTSIGSSSTAPFTFAWNTSTLSGGMHTLEAKAVDAAGNWGSHSITVSKQTTVISDPAPAPSSFSLVTPPIENQGSEASCVPFSEGYALRSIEEYYTKGATSFMYSSNIFSPEFLYNQTKVSDCNSGCSMSGVLEFMKTNGVCTWQSMPYSSANGCSLMPDSYQSSEALNYRITSYSGVYTTDVAAIKNMLLNKHPLSIAVTTDNSFNYATAGFVWRAYSGATSFRHAITIVGYDDSRNAFKVMNSWGTGWGDAGYSWIDYQFLSQCAGTWCYVVSL